MATKEMFNCVWRTQEPIVLEDPLYDILLHLSAEGEIDVSICDPQNLLHRVEGMSEKSSSDDAKSKILSLVVIHVSDCIQKIMSNGMISYFYLHEHLDDLSEVIKSRLIEILNPCGVLINSFCISKIEAPYKDYEKIDLAQKRRLARLGAMPSGESPKRIPLRGCICGAQMPEHAKFCIECGRKLPEKT